MSVRKGEMTKDGRCWIFKTIYVNLNGEKKYYSSKKYKTKKEAQEAERLFLLTLTDKFNYSDMTFGDLYNKYIDYKKDKAKQTTMHSYYKRWEHLSDLKSVKLCNFNSSHYELWRKKILNMKISDDYRNDIQKFLKILLNFATKYYNMNFTAVYNKISSFSDPNAPVKAEMKFFTYDEYKAFINEEDELIYKCAFDILYFCGLRRGELIGLKWSNVDLIKKEIKIRDNAVRDYENGGYVITSPKTKRSIRNIPLTNKLVEELKELKEEGKKIYGFKNTWYVLGYEEPMPFTRLLNRKNRNCDLAGLQQIRLHDFRHSCASLLISKGANITLVARYLGHTKIDETLNTYSHFFKSDLDSLVLTFDDLD